MHTLSTPDLHDENRNQVDVLEAGLFHFGGKQVFCGQAVTVTCPEDNSKASETVGQPGKGKVLIVDGFASKRFAFIGDQMAEKAVANEWEGIIVNGCVRDIEILKDMPIAVMALGSVPRSTTKRGFGDAGQKVHCLGVDILPGNWVYADTNGVLVSDKPL